MSVKIVTDSTADLPPELVRELNITVVPVYININKQSYRDNIDITPEEIYQNMQENDYPITTSQPSPNDFSNAFNSALKEADGVVSIQCSSHLSGTYLSAVKGRDMSENKNRIEVIDSKMISIPLGLVVVTAARLAQTGATISNVVESTIEAISQVHAWGVFNTLKYAIRSGRIGKIAGLVGSVLSVKPMLTLKDGVLHPTGVVRTRAKGIEKFIENVRKHKNICDIGIVHSMCLEEAQKLRAILSVLVDKNRIIISKLGAGVGSHGGPGTILLAIRATAKPIGKSVTALNDRVMGTSQVPSLTSLDLNTALLP